MVRKSERKPTSPRAGMMNSRRTLPLPWLIMSVISALRAPSASITVPMYSSGTSMISCSRGSSLLPVSSYRKMTSGLETASSYPSRRMVSMRMDRCSSPRPETDEDVR